MEVTMLSLRHAGKRRWSLCLAVLLLSAIAAPAQQLYQGPAQGSIPGGAKISTDDFGITDRPGIRKDKLPNPKENQEPVADRANKVPAAAPLGANEFYDANITPSSTDAPILIKGFQGIRDIGATIPPDPHMAAGPEHLVLLVNSQIGIYDKNGVLLKLIDADTWYANVFSGPGPCDPQVVYDHHAERFVMVWIECSSERYSLFLSISDDSNPLGEWSNWRLPGGQNGTAVTNFLNDYPKLGLDENAYYVTARMFEIQPTASFYRYLQLRIIPKAQLLDNQAGPVIWNDLWDIREPSNLNTRMQFIVPAVTFGTPGIEYLIGNSPYTTATFVNMWELIDPLGAAILIGTNIPVTATNNPSNANQLGGGTPLIDVGGARFRNAVYMNGSLWSAHSVAGGTGRQFVFARYVRLDVINQSLLEDVAFGADNFWYYYPAIHPDKNGNMHMVFTRSGTNEYASARYTGRLKTDPPGLQASATLKAGEANYVKDFGSGRNRWGDYLGIALDPVDSAKVWMFGQYAAAHDRGGNPLWGTWTGFASFEPLPGRHVRFDPDSIAFTTLEVGQNSAPAIITLSNIGADDLTISSISVANSNFVLSGIPALPRTLRSFGDLSFTVEFAPTVAGFLEGAILIASNDSDQPTSSIALTGRALGQVPFSGTVRDSVTQAPIQARLQFLRAGETSPRATVTTQNDGSFSAVVLEGDYFVTMLPEVPYPPAERENVAHTTPGTTLNFLLNPAPVVVVEDDTAGNSRDIYGGLLNELGYAYSLYNPLVEGATLPADKIQRLTEPQLIIWATGDTRTNVLTTADLAVIRGHLDRGNPLILTGDNIAETAPSTDSVLAHYFGVKFNSNYSPVVIRGFAGDPIGNGLTTGAPGNSKDQLELVAPGAGVTVNKVFRYGTSNADSVRIAAVRAQGGTSWRAALFGFRLEATTLLNRKQILQRAIDWVTDFSSAVDDKPVASVPQTFRLHQNHPNPFNPSTTISFELPQAATVKLQVFDLLGRQVATLIDGFKPAGQHRVLFDAGRLPAGEYLYRLQAGEYAETRKLVLMK